jgi:hypothetical protein
MKEIKFWLTAESLADLLLNSFGDADTERKGLAKDLKGTGDVFAVNLEVSGGAGPGKLPQTLRLTIGAVSLAEDSYEELTIKIQRGYARRLIWDLSGGNGEVYVHRRHQEEARDGVVNLFEAALKKECSCDSSPCKSYLDGKSCGSDTSQEDAA